jgi:hypothetical protein
MTGCHVPGWQAAQWVSEDAPLCVSEDGLPALPVVQLMQLVAATDGWYCPGSQFSQFSLCEAEEYVPSAQCMHKVWPVCG